MSENVGNLISDGSCSAALSGDPKLGAYSNGYYPLQSDSPAVNAGDAAHCLSADQIGTSRPQGDACDIGAFEVPAAQLTPSPTATNTLEPTATNTPIPVPTDTPEPTATNTPIPVPTDTPEPTDSPTVSPTATATSTPSPPITLGSGCTLPDAITAANTDTATGSCSAGSGADTIVFTADVTLSANTPQINSDITFNGNNYTLDGAGSHGLLYIADTGTVTINNLTLKNGSADEGGAIYVENGTLTINNSTLNNNSADWGGAIYVSVSGGTLTISDSSFSNNSATLGGAINAMQGTSTISGSSFRGNSADFGGAIISWGSLTISNSTLSNNAASSQGGAIYAGAGALTLNHITIADNSASAGNGIHVSDGTLKLRNSLLKDSGAGDACKLFPAATMSENVGNLISDGSCSAALSGDPKLGAYSNGYYPLQLGSPAINAGDAAHCLSADQIGTSRPQGSSCDIGAFEVPAAQLTPSPTATNYTRADCD